MTPIFNFGSPRRSKGVSKVQDKFEISEKSLNIRSHFLNKCSFKVGKYRNYAFNLFVELTSYDNWGCYVDEKFPLGINISIPVLTAINQFKESRKLFIKQTLFQADWFKTIILKTRKDEIIGAITRDCFSHFFSLK